MPETCPIIQLLGSCFGQYGSGLNFGTPLCAPAGPSNRTDMANTTANAKTIAAKLFDFIRHLLRAPARQEHSLAKRRAVPTNYTPGLAERESSPVKRSGVYFDRQRIKNGNSDENRKPILCFDPRSVDSLAGGHGRRCTGGRSREFRSSREL